MKIAPKSGMTAPPTISPKSEKMRAAALKALRGKKVYLGGCSGIKTPVDGNGHKIKDGDLLTWDFLDSDDTPRSWMTEPVYRVQRHKSGGFCAVGIHKSLYLHDFRFKFTKKCDIPPIDLSALNYGSKVQ